MSERLVKRRAFMLLTGMLIPIAIFLGLLNLAGGLRVGSSYEFRAVVPSAVQLIANSDVRIHGVRVGRVTEIATEGSNAVVTAEIDPEHGPISRDARTRVRLKTLVGESYLEVEPGDDSAPALAEGETLPIDRARDSVQLDEVLDSLAQPRRKRLREAIRGLGGGLREAEKVNATLGGASDLFANAAPTFETLARRQAEVGTLVNDLGLVFEGLADRETAIRGLVREGRATARIIGDENAAVRESLRLLPDALTQTQTTSGRLAEVGERARPVLDDLTGSLELLTPVARTVPRSAALTLKALEDLQEATPSTRALLDKARELVPSAVASVIPFGENLRHLRPALDQVAPYSWDLAWMLGVMRDVAVSRDDISGVGRPHLYWSSEAYSAAPPAATSILESLRDAGLFEVATTRGIKVNPKPRTQNEFPPPPGLEYEHTRRDPPIGEPLRPAR